MKKNLSKMLYQTAIKILLVMYISLKCAAQSQMDAPTSAEELETKIPEPRAYIPDTQYLDFIYHNHDELTKFLR